MASTKSKLIKKSTRSDLITYAMVLVVFAVVEILKSTGKYIEPFEGPFGSSVYVLHTCRFS